MKKIIDVEMDVERCRGPGKVREETWQDPAGKIARYNLAFIHHFIYQKDNGRVLGYDSAHGRHHRHFMGSTEQIEFVNYGALADKFFREVTELCQNTKKEN